jgi:SNARE protein
MSTQELMERGRKQMKGQDESLIRAQRIVESTIEVGTKTAETLHAQGEQMEHVLDTLDEIHFSMKKAGQVIRDITRGLATDKYAPVVLGMHIY